MNMLKNAEMLLSYQSVESFTIKISFVILNSDINPYIEKDCEYL